MFFKLGSKKFSSFHLIISTMVICIFFNLLFLCPQSNALAYPPVKAAFDSGQLSFYYSSCIFQYMSNKPYYNCSGDYSLNGTSWSTTTNEDGSITQRFRFSLNTPNSWGNTSYIKIKSLQYAGFDTSSWQNNLNNHTDSFFLKLTSPYSPYLGSARPFFSSDMGSRYSYTMGGFNAYFYNSTYQSHASCPDMDSSICQYRFDWDTETGLGGFYYLSKNATLPINFNNYTYITLLNNLYDSNILGHIWTYDRTDSTLYLLNPLQDATLESNGYLYLDFYATFYTTDEYFDMSANDTPGADVNDAISAEQEYIQDDLGNSSIINNALGNLSFNLSLPFSSWFNLFTNNSCVDLSIIPGWFGLSTQHICSPWNSTIRGVLTPVISVGSIMLLFGYIVRWIQGAGHSNKEV